MRRKFIYAAFVVLLANTLSCSDWLDQKPNDGIIENDFWYSKEDVRGAVIGCYISMMNLNLVRNIFYWGELRADMLTAGLGASNNIFTVVRGEFGPDNDVVKWDEFYTTINSCNKVIENAPKVKDFDKSFSDALCAQYIAEATVIRSLMYFYLVRSFKDVPFVLNASNNDQQDYYIPKTDGAIILDSLVAQLERARKVLANVNYGSNDSNKGRFTYYGATALLADVYLWKESNLECAMLCEQIIKSAQYKLVTVERTPKEIYDRNEVLIDTAYTVTQDEVEKWFNQLYVAKNSSESIFELQFPQTHPSWGDPFFYLFNSAANRPRMIPKEDNLDGMLFPDYDKEGVTDRTIKDIRSFTYQNRYVWKYAGLTLVPPTYRSEREYPNLIIYRLPDIILMRAEALTAMSDANPSLLQEAYELVKRIRERANAVETAATNMQTLSRKSLEKLILEERAREFLFEGKRWYDVLRFAKRNNYGGANRENLDYLINLAIYSAPPEKAASLKEKYQAEPFPWFHYWPIHTNAVEINKKLVQNEYFRLQ